LEPETRRAGQHYDEGVEVKNQQGAKGEEGERIKKKKEAAK